VGSFYSTTLCSDPRLGLLNLTIYLDHIPLDLNGAFQIVSLGSDCDTTIGSPPNADRCLTDAKQTFQYYDSLSKDAMTIRL
jgi:hypothetical protein